MKSAVISIGYAVLAALPAECTSPSDVTTDPPPTAAAPVGVAGFVLGATLEQAEATCTSGGGHWTGGRWTGGLETGYCSTTPRWQGYSAALEGDPVRRIIVSAEDPFVAAAIEHIDQLRATLGEPSSDLPDGAAAWDACWAPGSPLPVPPPQTFLVTWPTAEWRLECRGAGTHAEVVTVWR